MCVGHYLKPPVLFELAYKNRPITEDDCQPPSNAILTVFKYKMNPPPVVIQDTEQKVLLSVDETRMWFEHLYQIAENRTKGAKKEPKQEEGKK